jgi:hypothetical protein
VLAWRATQHGLCRIWYILLSGLYQTVSLYFIYQYYFPPRKAMGALLVVLNTISRTCPKFCMIGY